LAIDLRRRAKEFPYVSEDRALAIKTAKYLEQLAAKTDELAPYLAFLEEKCVPLTPEQEADLGIDNDDE
jgi:hypothetical protein